MTTRRKKRVYVVFSDCVMSEIDAVCASMETVQMYMVAMKDRILDFLSSDRVSVTIEEADLEEDGISYSVTSNVPGYGPVVCKAEVEDSEGKSLSEIQHVWVVWSVVDPYGHTVHLTEQAVEEYLKSKGWMDNKGSIKDNIVVQYEKFEVINSSRVKRNLEK
jgi:hypothetical protein